MDPLSISVELELATLILAAVGGIASWVHTRQQKALRSQRERQHHERMDQAERHHQERLRAIKAGQGFIVEDGSDQESLAPARPNLRARAKAA